MGKFGYLLNKYIHLNKKEFNQIVKEIKSKTGTSKNKIIKDIINCHFAYKASYRDYHNYEFYKLTDKEKATYITTGINQDLIEEYNKPVDYLNDRIKFYDKFKKYINREYLVINENNYGAFKAFTKKNPKIIAKSTDINNDKMGKVKVHNKNREDTFKELLHNKLNIVEEDIKEYPDLEKLHPKSLNTIRIITLNKKIVLAYLQIGTNDNISASYDENSIIAPVNIDTGLIDYSGTDKEKNIYDRHPDTNESILWFTIPKWPRIKRFVENLANEVPELKYVGWNICLNEKDPVLISATATPRSDIYQLPVHNNSKTGYKDLFIEELKGE